MEHVARLWISYGDFQVRMIGEGLIIKGSGFPSPGCIVVKMRQFCIENGSLDAVEPGIYIAEEGIGVRIEDDILIKEDGIENLSKRLSTEL